MKKFFFNEDKTIKTKRVVILTVVILLIGGGVILGPDIKAIIHNLRIDEYKRRTTTTINVCKDCDVAFKVDTVDLKVGEKRELSELLKLTNLNIMKVDFLVSDTDIVKIDGNGNKPLLVALDKAGETVVTAKFEDKAAIITVRVTYNEIKSIELHDKHYQVSLGERDIIGLNTNPSGIDLSQVDVYIKDSSIAYLDEEKRIVPVKVGDTEVVLNFNGVTTTKKFSVVNNRVIFYMPDGNGFKEVYELNIKDTGHYFNLGIQFQDNLGVGYVKEDLVFDISGVGMEGKIDYNGLNLSKTNFYNYRVNLTNLEGSYTSRYLNIKVSLPDGSSSVIKIIGGV